MDDRPLAGRLAAAVLTAAGWAVVAADGPMEALGVARVRRPCLLVTDYEMPILSGTELIAEVRALAANVPCVLVSGSPEAAGAARLAFAFFVEKPYLAATLLHATLAASELAATLREPALAPAFYEL